MSVRSADRVPDDDQVGRRVEMSRVEPLAGQLRHRRVIDVEFDAPIGQPLAKMTELQPDDAFEVGFGRDGLGVLPWVEGTVIVCPGGMTAKSKSSHRCRFVSVDDVWVWDCGLLLREDKRSSPGTDEGFRAIALVPLVDGTELDVVSGKARGGQHSVEHVVSYEVRSGELVEVSQRNVAAAHSR